MPYALGVDLGTTYTAAAVRRGDRLEIADLGTRTSIIPSVVYLREDGTVLTGEAATRRGVTDPGRLAREFKRRMGDTTAILLGGVPYSVDGLMARMLQAVVAMVTERQGEAPSAIAVAHPANWGQYKKDLLEQAVRRADLDNVTMITEPEAAAVHYATLERLDPGAVVAVYDLGGGTFDAAVLSKTADGFHLVGEPEGIERLGGIDFDEAVFRHVVTSLRGAVDDLDPDDPVAQSAVSRLRDECVAAKEALSSDTEVSIPVILPNVQTEVRLTRAEFEAMIRPALADTLVVLNRAMRSAGVTAGQLHSVLLVGGSSRIPLIAQLVGAELGRPVALDIHPKHSVALGAAAIAGGALPRMVAGPAPEPPAATQPVVVVPPPSVFPSVPDLPVEPVAAAGEPTLPVAPPPPPAQVEPTGAVATAPPPPPVYIAPFGGTGGTPESFAVADEPRRRRTGLLVGGGVLAVAALVAGGIVLFGGGDDGDAAASQTTDQAVEATDADPDATTAGGTEPPPDSTTGPTAAPTSSSLPPGPCFGITAEPCIVMNEVKIDETGTALVIRWEAHNFIPDKDNGLHPHFYWSNASAEQAGSNAPAGTGVAWEIDDQLIHVGETVLLLANRPPDAEGVCVTVGDAAAVPAHSTVNPKLFHCLAVPA